MADEREVACLVCGLIECSGHDHRKFTGDKDDEESSEVSSDE